MAYVAYIKNKDNTPAKKRFFQRGLMAVYGAYLKC